MLVQLRRRRLARKLSQTLTEHLLLLDLDILVREEDDTAVGDEGREILDEFVGVGRFEPLRELDGGVGEAGADVESLVAGLELSERTEDVDGSDGGGHFCEWGWSGVGARYSGMVGRGPEVDISPLLYRPERPLQYGTRPEIDFDNARVSYFFRNP